MSDEQQNVAPSTRPKVVAITTAKRELAAEHREHLRTSGLDDETIALAGVYSEDAPAELCRLAGYEGARPRWRNGRCLVFPYFVPGTTNTIFHRLRPDVAPKDRKTGKAKKYLQAANVHIAPYFTPRSVAEGRLQSVGSVLVFTEGEKKALLLDQLGYATIGSSGVDCFHDTVARQRGDGLRLHPLITEHATVYRRRCVILFDGDAHEKDEVMGAARRLAGILNLAGAGEVLFATPPVVEGGKGIDDFFVMRGAGDEARADVDAIIRTAAKLEPLEPDEPLERLRSIRPLRDLPIDDDFRLPSGFAIHRDLSLWEMPDEAPQKRIEHAPIFVSRILRDVYNGHHRIEVVFRGEASWVAHAVERSAIVNTRRAVDDLGILGAPIDSTTATDVVRWLRQFMATNEKRIPNVSCVATCGWHTVGGVRVFALGSEIIAAEDAKPAVVFDARLGRDRLVSSLSTGGDRDAHFAAMRRAFEADEVLALLICAALAAPLLANLEAQNFMVHTYGDSSRGKTTMLKIAASIYGSPRHDMWVAPWNATSVGVEQRAATFCDLPLCFDEAGQVDGETLVETVYMLVNGQGRVRGARHGGLRDMSSWRTIVLSTGERLAADLLAPTGAQARVLQPYVGGIGGLDASGVDELRSACEAHYGHVGREWIEGLADFTEWPALRRTWRDTTKALQRQRASPLASRQAAYIATLVVAEQLASSVLGFGDAEGKTMRSMHGRLGEDQEVVSLARRALESVRAWRQSNPIAFRDLKPALVPENDAETSGADPRQEIGAFVGSRFVGFLPPVLKRHLDSQGMAYETTVKAWRDEGFLLTDGDASGRSTLRQRVDGSPVRLVAVKREVFDGN